MEFGWLKQNIIRRVMTPDPPREPQSVVLMLDGLDHFSEFGEDTSSFSGRYVATVVVDDVQFAPFEYVERDGATDRKDNAWDKLVNDLFCRDDSCEPDQQTIDELRAALCYNRQLLKIVFDAKTPEGRLENHSPTYILADLIQENVADDDTCNRMIELLEVVAGFVNLGQIGKQKIWDLPRKEG